MSVPGSMNRTARLWIRGIARLARFGLVTMTIGCMTPAAPRSAPEVAAADGQSLQAGKVLVPAHTFQDVYYSAPFVGAPSLDVPDHWGRCVVVMQTPTRFRVLNSSGSDLSVEWKARGTKATVQPPALGTPQIQPAAASVPSPQPAADGLPAEPVPVTAPR